MVQQLFEAYLVYLPWLGLAIGIILVFFSVHRSGRRTRLFKVGFTIMLISIIALIFQLTG